jgi:hypothetical protein
MAKTMTDPIFVKTHYQDIGYDSYKDLWRLIELSGFPVRYVDEIDHLSDCTYIVPLINGEVGDRWTGATARIIHFNFELDPYPPTPGISETWHFDAWFANRYGVRYVPIGSHPDLAAGNGLDSRNYDVAYLAYMIPRRSTIHYELERRGLWLTPTGAWGDERHTFLRNSKSYLHVHQRDDAPTIPALRMVVAAAYKLPVFMEDVPDRGMFGYSTFLSASYAALPDMVKKWLEPSNATMLTEYGLQLYDLLCTNYTFRQSIEAAL